MLADLRHLARSLRRSPASAGAAILTLSLTLGAGASIMTVVDAVLLTPPPFMDPDALVTLREIPADEPTAASRRAMFATYEAWRERAGSLAALEAWEGTNLTLTELGPAERVTVNDVTPGFLALLGITPALGRGLNPEDLARPVAILSHAFWRGKLAADPGVIGREIALSGQGHTVVGVLPESFRFELNPAEVWRPLPITPAQAARFGYPVDVVARLPRHSSSASLAGALDDISRKSSPAARVVATPIVTAISRGAPKTLALLAGAAGLAVLIAFTNFAGLLIVRSIDRRRELAVRSALGARRFEIARQLLLEAQALVALGTIGGVLLALWMTPIAARLALQQFGGVAQRDMAIGWQVIAVMVTAASACALVCALVPAVMAARRSALDTLRRGATPAPRELALRRVFVSGEVALAFVLLACVTLLGGSLLRLLSVNPGFDARGVLTVHVWVPAATYNLDRTASFYSGLHSALEERLGPRAAAIVNEIPLEGSVSLTRVRVRPGDAGHEAAGREAGPAYFDVMRIPIVAGRSFEPRDNASAPPRVVISVSLAKRLFGSEPPIGRQLALEPGARMAEIIGVVGDVKHRALDEAVLPTVYLSALQAPSRSSIVVVRSARLDADAIAAVREEVARLDGNLPVSPVRSMQDVVAASPGMPARRVITATFMGFAVLALVLGAIGLFGVAAHDVASRRTELAVRIALGADPISILRATLGRGAVMVGSGLAVGAVLSIGAARALGSAGFATERLDALSIAVPVTVLLLTGVAAILPAARRAARTDPLAALRSD
jgi:putative ABC transport system permease protein